MKFKEIPLKKALRLAALSAALVIAHQAAFAIPIMPPPPCGSYCEPEGYGRGCLNSNGTKVQCTCMNGRWFCGI